MVPRLTRRQRQVLHYIYECVEKRGVPPTVREIAAQFGLRSPASALRHLQALERKGFLRRRPGTARGVELIKERVKLVFWRQEGIPVVGQVAAGQLLAPEGDEEDVEVENVFQLKGLLPGDADGSAGYYALRVRGGALREAGIHDGDLLLVRPGGWAQPGDVVVAVLDSDEGEERVLLTRLLRRGGQLALEDPSKGQELVVIEPSQLGEDAENGARIVGVAVGLIRLFRSAKSF
jgi:repressor LexA